MLYFDGERSSMVKVNLHLFGGMAGKHAFCLKASFTKGFEISCQFLDFSSPLRCARTRGVSASGSTKPALAGLSL